MFINCISTGVCVKTFFTSMCENNNFNLANLKDVDTEENEHTNEKDCRHKIVEMEKSLMERVL